MKKLLILMTLLAFTSSIFALSGEIVYAEGTVDIKTLGGTLEYGDIGMPVETGESVITGYDGYAELEMEDGSTIKVNEDSVFKLESLNDEEGKSKNSFQLILGSAKYKFARTVKDEEPMISTPSTVCGLRGTEFTVFSGLDGSALYAVEEGAVAVSARGKEVRLGAEQGVKVAAGSQPGEPYSILRGQLDYSTFRLESQAAFWEDPAGSVYALMEQLLDFARKADNYQKNFEVQKEILGELDKKLEGLDGEERKDFYREVIFPAEIKTSGMRQNVRYYALSAFSMRRFMLGNMYVQMNTSFVHKRNDPVYLDFMDAYGEFMKYFEKRIVPYLLGADIYENRNES